MRALQDLLAKIRQINGRYRQPRIEMSAAVRWSLLALRLYLFVLVGLMIYKFILLATGR
jgi:hypothetical protein